MVETPSTMFSLGTRAPDFALEDAVKSETFRLEDFEGKVLVVMFICNHCPFVVHVRDEITRVATDYAPRGVSFAAINSNSIDTHPQDGPEHMKALATELQWKFPFFFDGTQAVAKAYRAACTPDFYVFDQDRRLVYRGQLDDSRPSNNKPVDGRDLRRALDAVLGGEPVPEDQRASIGCNIKWAPGNEPDYFGTS